MADFEEQIDRFVIDTEKKLLNVVGRAIRDTVEDAQKAASKESGGKMPVDTGFLRWSGLAALNAVPAGEGRGRHRKRGEKGVLPEYVKSKDSLTVTLAKMKIGDTFYWGWTAKYAKYQEAYKGFLESALRNFKTHVANAVSEFKR